MAEKKTRDKKFHSINGRIYILIFILTLVTAAIGTLNTSRLYIDLLDSTYQEKSVEISGKAEHWKRTRMPYGITSRKKTRKYLSLSMNLPA